MLHCTSDQGCVCLLGVGVNAWAVPGSKGQACNELSALHVSCVILLATLHARRQADLSTLSIDNGWKGR
jgi:hypothetical protein